MEDYNKHALRQQELRQEIQLFLVIKKDPVDTRTEANAVKYENVLLEIRGEVRFPLLLRNGNI